MSFFFFYSFVVLVFLWGVESSISSVGPKVPDSSPVISLSWRGCLKRTELVGKKQPSWE